MVKGRTKVYRLTERGRERLEYVESLDEQRDGEDSCYMMCNVVSQRYSPCGEATSYVGAYIDGSEGDMLMATSESSDEWEECRHKRILETRRPVEIEVHEMYDLYFGSGRGSVGSFRCRTKGLEFIQKSKVAVDDVELPFYYLPL